jgi:hypothetical protein
MPFYDQMARGAIRDGNTSHQFRAAAQNWANWTWVFLAIGGVVWYFTSWMWALIPFGLAVLTASQSISSTAIAMRLEKHESENSRPAGAAPVVKKPSDNAKDAREETIRKQLAELLATLPPTGHLVQDRKGRPLTYERLRRRFESARQAAGVDFEFRDIRPKSATDIYDSQGTAAASALLGHASASTTDRYFRQRAGRVVRPVSRKL